ncbi:MAG: B12-binding domain-containing radical SAM protein, partial [Planctomycetes bacterium]|nr:B12-binding domain-containing radical SAM protein [Planctomycetota bacterium]
MSRIVLTTLNARYWHSAFGLRYLQANMGPLRQETTMLEFGIGENPVDILAALLEYDPQIVGMGIYIWNVEPATKLVADLKRVRPDITVVLGGPEVSYETEGQRIVELADYVITGEADLAFSSLCQSLLKGEPSIGRPGDESPIQLLPALSHTGEAVPGIIAAPPPQFDQLALPYDLYTDEDIAHRVIYVEASRGCPFACEFCLSALDIPVRQADLDAFLAAMQRLLDRGARQFKFVDRTFNLNLRFGRAILQFFLDRYETGLFLHFEMIPDRLPEPLRELIALFPSGALQFEIGVQTFNEDVGQLISRTQDNEKLAENFRFLREQTGVHIHADLIVGLPGETLESFGEGFDRLVALKPQEIQVGILKRLKGTPIIRHDDPWQMTYSDASPYEILSNSLIDFATMQRLRRFARFWDLIGNSGNFRETANQILSESDSAFESFLALCDWLFSRERKAHGISLQRLAEHLFEFLTTEQSLPREEAAEIIWRDYTRSGRHDRPAFLRGFYLPHPQMSARGDVVSSPRRQTLHA